MVHLTREHFDQMVQHAKEKQPHEVCGILAGRDNTVELVYKMANDDNSATTYLANPKEQFQVFKDIRERQLEMIGIYHSHVFTEPYPSARDVELAFYPDSMYFIVSLRDPGHPEVKAYRITEGQIEEEEIIVRDEGAKLSF